MKKRILAFALALALTLSLCSCFPTKGRNEAKTEDGKITFEQLSSTPAHVEEAPFDKFTINADVKLNIKGGFDLYKAKSIDCDINSLQNIFLKDKKITETFSDGWVENTTADNGSSVTRQKDPGGFSLSFGTREERDKSLSYFYYDSFGVKPNRAELFPMKELSFMSSADAIAIVDNVMKQMNIPVLNYSVYPVDYDFMKNSDQKELELYGKTGFVDHTKEDEFYAIVPKISVPNGSAMVELENVVLVDYSPYPIDSGLVHAVVGKNGLLKFSCKGCYNCGPDGKADSIISLETAIKKLKDKYKNIELTSDTTVYDIELAYSPYLADKDACTFTLKPTWVFSVRENKTENGINCDRFMKEVYDAVTGEEVLKYA